VIAGQTRSAFKALSAVLAGVKDIKEAVEEAKFRQNTQNRRTILFVDEIHRFNKSQQDALLPHVEDGTVTLVGATTENPSFELNAALLSRVRVIHLDALDDGAIQTILRRALADPEASLRPWLTLSDDALAALARAADGDARRALTLLETLSLSVAKKPEFTGRAIEVADLKLLLSRQPIRYDKAGEEHYNVISAFIKSMRASAIDAALYYLARMLEGGEDPVFIARRMVIFASEDIGVADSRALLAAIAVKEAVEFVGMPEARIPLAHGVSVLCRAPKNNSAYVAIDRAIEEVRESGALPVPDHLRNTGSGYIYPHDNPEEASRVNYLPEALRGRRFFEPTS
jgi:putative ATPase